MRKLKTKMKLMGLNPILDSKARANLKLNATADKDLMIDITSEKTFGQEIVDLSLVRSKSKHHNYLSVLIQRTSLWLLIPKRH
jgi:hypothetical protein